MVLIALRYFNRLKLPTHTHTHTNTTRYFETVISKNPIWKLVLHYISGRRTAVSLDSESPYCFYFTEVIHVYSDNSQGAVIVQVVQVS